jgi:hypothetical protein
LGVIVNVTEYREVKESKYKFRHIFQEDALGVHLRATE